MDTIGQRILVWGNSCSGKSTLAKSLALHHDLKLIELDALNWLPNWQGLNATDPERLTRRMRAATQGDRWVADGSYTSQAREAFWPKLDTVIWLDLPRPLLLRRCLQRSWQRWRSQELLWGTTRESFMKQLKVWRGEESLLWWVYTQHHRKRTETQKFLTDGTWRDVTFIRLTSEREVAEFVSRVTASHGTAG